MRTVTVGTLLLEWNRGEIVVASSRVAGDRNHAPLTLHAIAGKPVIGQAADHDIRKISLRQRSDDEGPIAIDDLRHGVPGAEPLAVGRLQFPNYARGGRGQRRALQPGDTLHLALQPRLRLGQVGLRQGPLTIELAQAYGDFVRTLTGIGDVARSRLGNDALLQRLLLRAQRREVPLLGANLAGRDIEIRLRAIEIRRGGKARFGERALARECPVRLIPPRRRHGEQALGFHFRTREPSRAGFDVSARTRLQIAFEIPKGPLLDGRGLQSCLRSLQVFTKIDKVLIVVQHIGDDADEIAPVDTVADALGVDVQNSIHRCAHRDRVRRNDRIVGRDRRLIGPYRVSAQPQDDKSPAELRQARPGKISTGCRNGLGQEIRLRRSSLQNRGHQNNPAMNWGIETGGRRLAP